MKFIQKINTFLLHRYPTIWNTKIVWMLSIALLVHLFFFFVGYIFYSNPTSLHSWVSGDYFSSGIIYIHILFSLIILVAWVTQLLKNNAFNNFYPMTFPTLFGQFLQYIIIIFANITFAFSFFFGNKVYINKTYPDKKYAHYIDIANKGNVFLPVNIDKYLLNYRIFPEPFSDLYCETEVNKIDFSKPYFKFCNRYFQFYNTVLCDSLDEKNFDKYSYYDPSEFPRGYVTYSKQDTLYYLYCKEKVIDVSNYAENAKPNFRNFSSLFVYPEEKDSDYETRIYTDIDEEHKSARRKSYPEEYKLSQYINKTLNDNNKAELERLIEQFLQMSKELAIHTNLDKTSWFSIIYTPETNFEVQTFIKNGYYDDYHDSYEEPEEVVIASDSLSDSVEYDGTKTPRKSDENQAIGVDENIDCSLRDYRYERLSDYYYDFNELENSFENIHYLKNYTIDDIEFFFHLWFSIGLALLLFGYRVFKLKALLLSGVTTGVIVLLSALFVLFAGINGSHNTEMFIYGLSYFVYLVILAVAVFLPYNGHKNIKAILINIAFIGFPIFVLLILYGIDERQKNYSYEIYDYTKYPETIFDYLSITEINLIVLISSLIFWFIYTRVIMKWKASSE